MHCCVRHCMLQLFIYYCCLRCCIFFPGIYSNNKAGDTVSHCEFQQVLTALDLPLGSSENLLLLKLKSLNAANNIECYSFLLSPLSFKQDKIETCSLIGFEKNFG